MSKIQDQMDIRDQIIEYIRSLDGEDFEKTSIESMFGLTDTALFSRAFYAALNFLREVDGVDYGVSTVGRYTVKDWKQTIERSNRQRKTAEKKQRAVVVKLGIAKEGAPENNREKIERMIVREEQSISISKKRANRFNIN